MQSYKKQKALADPGRYFASPAALCNTHSHSDEEKIALLQAWERNTRQLMVAEGEGLAASGDNPNQSGELLQAIHDALVLLGIPHDPERAQTDSAGSSS